MKKVIVIGSGGHAKVVIDILQEMGDIDIFGITSNSLIAGSEFNNYPVIGNDDVLATYDNKDYFTVMGIGGFKDNSLRKHLYEFIKSLGFNFINAIHPKAVISKTARLGEGVSIFPGVVINSEVELGNNTIIATGSTIDHETVIGNHVLISAGVTIGAYSRIHDNALIALGAKVVSGVNIGTGALVAAGAVVINDVSADQTVYGIPAMQKD